MQLLEPQEVKQEYDQKTEEQAERVRKLRDAENLLVQNLNATREKVGSEIARLTKELEDFETKGKNHIHDLLLEVSSLENRKKEALKPIEAEQKQLDERKIDIDRGEKALVEAKVGLDAREFDLNDRRDDLDESETLVQEREDLVSLKESNLVKAEDRHKASEEALSKRWAEFHVEVARANTDLLRREKEVIDGRIANEAIRAELTEERKRMSDERVSIRDTYRAIEQAKQHLGVKI